MNITILGTGNMAQGLASVFAKAGYTVTLGSRDAVKAKDIAKLLGASVTAETVPVAAAKSDVIFLAVPFSAAADTIKAAGGLAGKTLVDISTPATVFGAGDDEAANKAVEAIAAKAGFATIQSNGLRVARYLEPVAGLNIVLGYGKGLGTDIAPTWLRAA